MIRKRIKQLSLLAGFLLFCSLILGIIVMWLYGDSVKKYILNSINQQLKIEIEVQKIEFSVFKDFPKASLIFKNLNGKEVNIRTPRKNLFEIKELQIAFNIWNIFSNNYTIEKLSLKDGYVHLWVNEKGENNYHFWKTSTDTSNVAFELKELRLKNIQVDYQNIAQKINSRQNIHQLFLHGKLADNQLNLALNSDIQIQQFKKDSLHIQDKFISLQTDFFYQEEKQEYQIKRAQLIYEQLPLSLTGFWVNKPEKINLSFQLKTENINLHNLWQLYPKELPKDWQEKKFTGLIDIEANILGSISEKDFPGMDLDFKIKNGSFTLQNNLLVKEIFITGKLNALELNNPSSTNVLIEKLNAKIENSEVEAQGMIQNLAHPFAIFRIKGQVDLSNFNTLKDSFDLQPVSGKMDFLIQGKSSLNNFLSDDYLLYGYAKMTKSQWSLKQNDKKWFIQVDSTIFNLQNEQLSNKKLKLNFKNSEIEMSLQVNQLLSFLQNKNSAQIIGEINSPKINLNELSEFKSNSETKTHSNDQDMEWFIKTKIAQITYNKTQIKNFNAWLEKSKHTTALNNLEMEWENGKIKGNILIENNKNNLEIKGSEIELIQLNVQKLVNELNQIDIRFLQENQTKGWLNGKLNFKSSWNQKNEFVRKNLALDAQLEIKKGELNNYEPLQSISNFLNLKALKNIKFTELSADVTLKNEKIELTKARINSDLLEMDIFGQQYIDGEINYSINLALYKLLSKELKNNENTIDDGLGKTRLFLKLSGKSPNIKIRYDLKQLKQKFKQDLKQEKQSLKQSLNKEFKLFKSDSTLQQNQIKKSKPKMEVIFK